MASSLKVVQVQDLRIGDLVAVKSGDKVPVDGTVESGTSTINEANLTGESRPVLKEPGDGVHAGTINVGGGYLIIRTTALSEDSAMARLIKLVQQAQAQSSPTEQLVMRVAKVYTPVVVLVALVLATVPWAWGPEVGRAYLRTALVSLIIACPCALVISTPITYVCGLAHAARIGILAQIAALHLIAHDMHHLGNTAHANATNADNVHPPEGTQCARRCGRALRHCFFSLPAELSLLMSDRA